MDDASEAEEGRVRGGRQMSEEARINYLFLLAWFPDGTHLPYGAIANIACKLLCSSRAVRKIWMQLLDGKKPLDIVKSKKNGNANANCYDPDDLVKKICLLPINYCQTLRDISDNLGISPETVCALVKTKKLQKKRHNLKLRLTEAHKESCLSWI